MVGLYGMEEKRVQAIRDCYSRLETEISSRLAVSGMDLETVRKTNPEVGRIERVRLNMRIAYVSWVISNF
jgi:hypothetical protein